MSRADPPWTVKVVTLFPEVFPGPLSASLAGRALRESVWRLETSDIRAFATDRHHSVDAPPSGGGPGMVLRADVLEPAVASIHDRQVPLICMSARGVPLSQTRVRELALEKGATIICGRFEGIDQRFLDARQVEEISIADCVLSGGEIAAMVLIDAVVRLLPGVMGSAESAGEESFSGGLLEYPHYTRPRSWEGLEIPPVLLSGDHGAIRRWRRQQAEDITRQRRPDLLRGRRGDDN